LIPGGIFMNIEFGKRENGFNIDKIRFTKKMFNISNKVDIDMKCNRFIFDLANLSLNKVTFKFEFIF
jgi:hypothetical protein